MGVGGAVVPPTRRVLRGERRPSSGPTPPRVRPPRERPGRTGRRASRTQPRWRPRRRGDRPPVRQLRGTLFTDRRHESEGREPAEVSGRPATKPQECPIHQGISAPRPYRRVQGTECRPVPVPEPRRGRVLRRLGNVPLYPRREDFLRLLDYEFAGVLPHRRVARLREPLLFGPHQCLKCQRAEKAARRPEAGSLEKLGVGSCMVSSRSMSDQVHTTSRTRSSITVLMMSQPSFSPRTSALAKFQRLLDRDVAGHRRLVRVDHRLDQRRAGMGERLAQHRSASWPGRRP